MYEQHSVFKYLKHQSRCIEAQLGEEDRHCFFIGTYTPQPENELHLVEFIEETNEIITRNIFHHPNEIYSISSCPTNASLLFTTHRGGHMDAELNKVSVDAKNEEAPENETESEEKSAAKTSDQSLKKSTDNPDLYKATLWKLISEDGNDNLDAADMNDDLQDDSYQVQCVILARFSILCEFNLFVH